MKLSPYSLIKFLQNNCQFKINPYVLDVLKDSSKIIVKDPSNSIEKLSENKSEMLLEAISSDDDIAMDSEEDGLLVLYTFTEYDYCIIYINYTF